MRSACFTGHRVLSGDIYILKNKLRSVLEDLITEENYTVFYSGGAVGWDTLAAQTVLSLREKYPMISLCLVLPCPPEEQTAKWNASYKSEYMDILRQADKSEYISRHYTSDCMKLRNSRLVEYADCCICFWSGKKIRSGTYQTVRMAQKKKIPLINLFSDEE